MSHNNRVVWSEGMFLEPHHFQQQDRYVEQLVEGRAAPLAAYGWGYATFELDAAAAALGKVQMTTGRGVLPDGTPFDFPAVDAPPLPLEVGNDDKDEPILLALPIRRAGAREIAAAGDPEVKLARFRIDEAEAADAHGPTDRHATLQIGRLNLQLLRKRDLSDAYCGLGCVRITERRADNQVVFDRRYIPPVLHAAADATLAAYLRELHGLLHQRGEVLAARLGQPGRGGVAEIADFLYLQTINRYEPLFVHLAAHSLLHPARLYEACLMLAGDLATFSRNERRPAAYPEYRHDAIETCFPPLIAEIRKSLSMVLEQNAVPIELQDRKFGVRVALIPDLELLKNSSFVLAVNAQLAPDVLRMRFPTQTKIGPVERIRDLVNLQLPGIPLRALPVAPRQIRYHAGFNYFELEPGGELWKQLERSGGMAMHVAGEFPGLELEFWAIRN